MSYSIKVENLSKKYHISKLQEEGAQGSLLAFGRQLFMEPIKRTRSLLRGQPLELSEDYIWALQDVSFEVQPGEVIGVIGKNGAGKSTLLKILSRITPPTDGRIHLRGRVASMLEVGTGFHQELTGRENVYMNGTILGMSRREIDAKFDEIVAFSGIEKHIDTPVKRYSSGMRVRLGFAVAAHLEPEILLIDEVLSVGDIAFQKKSLGKMEDITSQGRTVLFVSHNLESILGLCPRTILIDGGQIVMDDHTPQVLSAYHQLTIDATNDIPLDERTDRKGSGSVRLNALTFHNQDMEPVGFINAGEDLYIRIGVSVLEAPVANLSFWVSFLDRYDNILMRPWSKLTGEDVAHIEEQDAVICHIPKLPLIPGEYYIAVGVMANGQKADYIKNATKLTVANSVFYDAPLPSIDNNLGKFLVAQHWFPEKARS